MVINFSIKNQTLDRTSDQHIVEGSEQYLKLCFSFSDDWDGLTKSAVILPRGANSPIIIYTDENDCCYIPRTLSGVCAMSLIGTDGIKTITTNIISITLERTLPADNATDLDNPRSDFSVLIEKMKSIAEEMENSVAERVAGKADKTDVDTALSAKANQSDVDTALAAKAEQSDVDVINAALSGMYKNKGDVSEMTLDIPVPSSEINNVYNVKKGFTGGAAYGKGGAFRCRVEIKNAYIKKDDDGIYYLCFTRNGLPSEMYYFNQSAHTFFGSYNDEVEFYPEENPQYKWRFAYFCTLPLSGTAEISARYTGSYGPGIDSYMSDKTFTGGKYQLGDIKTIWYRNDINPDDDFSITEHGYNLLTYKVTDYVNADTVNNMIVRHTAPLSSGLALKANKSDVYTKTEIDGAGYVKDTDYPKYENNTSYAGVVKISPDNGVTMAPGGFLRISQADAAAIGTRSSLKAIIPPDLNTAVKAALSDDKRISDMTDAEKANARDVIGAAGKSDVYTKTETDSAISAAIADSVGDIDTALDGIIALQNSLIGGGTA